MPGVLRGCSDFFIWNVDRNDWQIYVGTRIYLHTGLLSWLAMWEYLHAWDKVKFQSRSLCKTSIKHQNWICVFKAMGTQEHKAIECLLCSNKEDLNIQLVLLSGKLFKTEDLPLIVEFFVMFYKDKPIDWLLDHLFWVKVCNPEKNAVSMSMHLWI